MAATATSLTVQVPAATTSGPIQVKVANVVGLGPWFTAAASGSIVATYPLPGTGASELTFDLVGNLWITEYTSNDVVKLSPTGVVLGRYSTGFPTQGVAVDPTTGNIWVRDISGSNHVSRFTPAGVSLGDIILPGTAIWGLIAFDSLGNAWIPSYDTGKVFEYASAGTLKQTLTTAGGAYGVAIDGSDNVWVVNNGTDTVSKLAGGAVVSTQPAGAWANGIAVAPNGDVWVANDNGNSVSVFAPNGTLRTTYASPGGPHGIAIGPDGHAWLTDEVSNDLRELSPSGVTLKVIPLAGPPKGVQVAANGQVWVSVSGVNQVVVIAP